MSGIKPIPLLEHNRHSSKNGETFRTFSTDSEYPKMRRFSKKKKIFKLEDGGPVTRTKVIP